MPIRSLGQKIQVKRIIAGFEKGLLPPVSALRNVVRNAGKNCARKSQFRTVMRSVQ
jgi:hypothetical protein